MNATLNETQAKTYHGFVLDIFERNMHDDSDFYAIVWDEETQTVKTISDGTTRAYAPSIYQKCDAPAEIRAKAEKWIVEQHMPGIVRKYLEAKATRIQLQDWAEVVKGRKVPVGARGVVVWMGRDKFHRQSRYGGNALGIKFFDAKEWRVGIELAPGDKVYTSLDNVRKIGIPQITDEQVKTECRRLFTSFRSAMSAEFALSCLAA